MTRIHKLLERPKLAEIRLPPSGYQRLLSRKLTHKRIRWATQIDPSQTLTYFPKAPYHPAEGYLRYP